MYFMDVSAPAQFITAPAQLPATGAVVYTALFLSLSLHLYDLSLRVEFSLETRVAVDLTHDTLLIYILLLLN